MGDKDAVKVYIKKKLIKISSQGVSVFPHYALVFYFPLLFSFWKYSYYGDNDDMLRELASVKV